MLQQEEDLCRKLLYNFSQSAHVPWVEPITGLFLAMILNIDEVSNLVRRESDEHNLLFLGPKMANFEICLVKEN